MTITPNLFSPMDPSILLVAGLALPCGYSLALATSTSRSTTNPKREILPTKTLVEAVRADPRAKTTLLKLKDSSNNCIKSYAQAALKHLNP
ncbi:MAG: hypothetical protein ACJAVK_002435 [Akkermansiaceae bacterium]|jgi:hypothetical protein